MISRTKRLLWALFPGGFLPAYEPRRQGGRIAMCGTGFGEFGLGGETGAAALPVSPPDRTPVPHRGSPKAPLK